MYLLYKMGNTESKKCKIDNKIKEYNKNVKYKNVKYSSVKLTDDEVKPIFIKEEHNDVIKTIYGDFVIENDILIRYTI